MDRARLRESWRARLGVAALACALFAVLGSSCLRATAIDTRVYSEVACVENAPVSIIVGSSLDDLAARMAQGVVSSTQSGCVSADGYVGDVVMLPEQTDESVVFAVMARADGQPSEQCGTPAQAAGCIVAKRHVSFLTHQQFGVRVDLRLSCLGVTCPTDQTCVQGQCVSALVPTSCTPPCGEDSLTAQDAGAPDATLDGTASDAARDTGASDAPPDAVTADGALDAGAAPDGDGGATDAADGGVLPFASCAPGGPGMTTCGGGTESCCASPAVPGAPFFRTYSNGPDGGVGGVSDPATVSNFRLDRYLVTVGRFRQFANAWAAGYRPPAGAGKHTHVNGGQGLVNLGPGGGFEPGWLASDDANVTPTTANLVCSAPYATWTDTPGTHENLPIDCVNWWESYAFCTWDGGFLPSVSEATYAAAGGNQQRENPWGAAAPGTANQYLIYACYYPSGSGTCTSVANIAPVGSAPLGVGRWGQLDLAGELWEWSLDADQFLSPCTDCGDFEGPTSDRHFRGASFNAPTLFLGVKGSNPPASRDPGFGFRCARAP